MKQIKDFDKIEASTGGSKRIPVGGYVVGIFAAQDVPDKEYLKIFFDVVEGEHKLFYKKKFDSDTRDDKKWPMDGSTIRSYKEKALPMFKGFTTAVENSNKGYKWDWDESTLKGKKFGVVIGEEEYVSKNNGKTYVRSYVAAIRSADTIRNGDFEVPELKKLDQSAATKQEAAIVNPFEDADTAASANAAATNDNPWADDSDNPFV